MNLHRGCLIESQIHLYYLYYLHVNKEAIEEVKYNLGFQKKVTKMNKTAKTSAITARIMKTRTKLIQLPT